MLNVRWYNNGPIGQSMYITASVCFCLEFRRSGGKRYFALGKPSELKVGCNPGRRGEGTQPGVCCV